MEGRSWCQRSAIKDIFDWGGLLVFAGDLGLRPGELSPQDRMTIGLGSAFRRRPPGDRTISANGNKGLRMRTLGTQVKDSLW